MKINTIAKKGIVLMVLSVIISCGGSKSSDNKPNEQEKKEVKASQEEVSNKKEVKSYEEELKERMDPIEAKLNKTIESGENMLEASFELSEKMNMKKFIILFFQKFQILKSQNLKQKNKNGLKTKKKK